MAETIGDILKQHPKFKQFMEEALKENNKQEIKIAITAENGKISK